MRGQLLSTLTVHAAVLAHEGIGGDVRLPDVALQLVPLAVGLRAAAARERRGGVRGSLHRGRPGRPRRGGPSAGTSARARPRANLDPPFSVGVLITITFLQACSPLGSTLIVLAFSLLARGL